MGGDTHYEGLGCRHESQWNCTLIQTKDPSTLVGDEGLQLISVYEQGGDTVSTQSWDIHVADWATTGVSDTCSVVREHVERVRGLTSRLLVLYLAEPLLCPHTVGVVHAVEKLSTQEVITLYSPTTPSEVLDTVSRSLPSRSASYLPEQNIPSFRGGVPVC